MSSEDWVDKMKRKDNFQLVQIDEIALFFTGLVVFFLCNAFLFIFVILILMWYWFKIRYYERMIVYKKRDIYNVQYDNIEGVTLEFSEGRTAEARRPMYYDLERIETIRRFLVEKFVIVNLVLIVLLELQK